MQDIRFIEEVSNSRKVKSLIVTLFILVILLFIGMIGSIYFSSLQKIPVFDSIYTNIGDSIENANLIGMFYANLVGGIFFIPSPDELIFYYGLTKGNPVLLVLLFTMLGYMVAQILNYIVGSKLSEPILNLVSKKKVYEGRRYINKYGAYGIFIFNLLPFPAPLLSFGLGIAKYNFMRLMLLTIAGKTLKYIVIICIYLLIN